jgi:hypothetical protein
MEMLEYDHEGFTRPRAGDEKLAIRFFKKASQDMEQTKEQGRPIFSEIEYIQIMIPGDKGTVIVRPIGIEDRQRFGRQYDDWARSNKDSKEILIGTPLESWTQMSLAQVEEFRYFGVRTVEHLATLRDDVMLKMPGAISLKKKAQEFLDTAKEAAPLSKMQAELEKRDTDIAVLQNALKEQGEMIAKLQRSQPKELHGNV